MDAMEAVKIKGWQGKSRCRRKLLVGIDDEYSEVFMAEILVQTGWNKWIGRQEKTIEGRNAEIEVSCGEQTMGYNDERKTNGEADMWNQMQLFKHNKVNEVNSVYEDEWNEEMQRYKVMIGTTKPLEQGKMYLKTSYEEEDATTQEKWRIINL